MGELPLQDTKVVNLLNVNTPCEYNVILGRLSLNLFQAVVLTYHMKLKFPTGKGNGEIAGDQLCSRKCYTKTIKKAGNSSPREKERESDVLGKEMKAAEVVKENPK